MKTKDLIVGVVVAAVLMTGWYVGVWWLKKANPDWVYGVRPTPPAQTQPADTQPDATQPTDPDAATRPTVTDTPPPTPEQPAPKAPDPAPGDLSVEKTEGPAAPVALGSAQKEDETFAMQLRLHPRGGGVQEVLLNDFNRDVKDKQPYSFQSPYPGHEALTRPLATRWVKINGATIDLSNVEWTLDSDAGGSTATYSVRIVGPEGLVARISKKFLVPQRDTKSQGFEVGVEYTIQNLTNAPLRVQTEFNGPTVPPEELARAGERIVIAGYRHGGAIKTEQRAVESFTESKPSQDLLRDSKGERHAYWAGGASAFFNAILLPVPLGDQSKPADYIDAIRAEGLDLHETKEILRKVAISFRTKELTIEPNQSVTLPLAAYFGPRRRSTLSTPYYALLPRGYYSTLVIPVGPCSFCTFDWLISGLVTLLGFFHWIFKDWGLAIICLVALVRTLLHPITKKSQVHMMKMGKMGPEMEKLKAKYKDDKDELNKAMMQFYKQQGFTPVLGCLPMFLQMPIWIALWSALQSTFELRQAPFLYGLTWIDDLSKPDGLLRWEPVNLIFGFQIAGLNILPLLLAVVFWLQQKYTPKPPVTNEQQAQQQKMMQWMVLLFPIFLYSGPSGLNLYILTSTTIGIIEAKVIRKHIKEREELEKLNAPVMVEAAPTRGSRRKGREESPPPPKKGGVMGWLADLQAKAEEVRRDQDRRDRKKPG